MLMLGRAEGVVTLDISDLQSKAAQATASLGGLDSAAGRFDNLESQLNSVGLSTDRVGAGFLTMGAAILAPIGIGVKNAMELEQSMKNVEVALGDVNQHDFERLTRQIQEIGSNGEFSANEIAIVSEELAKAGYNIDQIMSGDPAAGFGNMAQAVSDLASATGDGLGPAVEGIVVAMSTWKPEIVGVENAVTDASKAADIFTIAANESTAGVSDIINGMRNFGPTAALMGVGFDEAAASIAVFTNYGLRAREAGTSLTRALTVLADPTSEASELMTELGISAFDLEGNFVGLPNLMQQLNTNMRDMSQEARLAALSTIFGAEAMDVMGLAVLGAGDDVEALIEMMNGGDGYVSAADQAKERTNTLAGSLERLREGLGTFLGMLATGLIRPLRILSDGLDRVIALMASLPSGVLSAIGLVVTGIGVLLTATGSFLIMGPRVLQFVQTVRLLSTLQGPLGTAATGFLRLLSAARLFAIGFSGIGAIIGAVALAVRFDLFGFADAWGRAVDAYHQAAGAGNRVVGVLNAIAAALKSFDLGPLNAVADTITAVGTGWMAFWDGFGAGAEQGTKQIEEAIDTSGILIDRIADASGADGFRYLLMETNVDTGELEEVGRIIESHDDPNDPTKWWARVEIDGKEHEVWIDKNTGEVTPIPVEVEVRNPDHVPSMMERIQNGFLQIRQAGETLRLPWLENIGQWGLDGTQTIQRLQNAFDLFRKHGSDPVHASLGALSQVFPGLNRFLVPIADGWLRMKAAGAAVVDVAGDMLGRLGSLASDGFDRVTRVAQGAWKELSGRGRRAWDRFSDTVESATGRLKFTRNVFKNLVDSGLDPVRAGIRAVGTAFPSLSGQMTRLERGVNTVTSVFRRFRNEGLSPLRAGIETVKTLFSSIDWGSVGSSIMSGLRSAFGSIGSVFGELGTSVLEGLTGISDSIGHWIADLFDTDEGTVGGGAGKGRFGAALTDEMRDELERAAKGAWERAWDNFRTWVGQRVEELGNVAVRVGEWLWDNAVVPVWDWLQDTAIPAMGEAVVKLGTVAVNIGGWVIEQAGNLRDAVMRKLNTWLYGSGVSGGGAAAGGAAAGKGFPIEDLVLKIMGIVLEFGERALNFAATELVPPVEAAAEKAFEAGWGLVLGKPTVIFGFDLDYLLEEAVGRTIELAVDALLIYGWEWLNDPGQMTRAHLLGILAVALTSLAVTVGLGSVLTVVGIGILAYAIYNAARDYFDRNPLVLENIKLRIGEWWEGVKASDIGWLATFLEEVAVFAWRAVNAGIAFRNWLHGLPGPLGSAASAVEKLALAIAGLLLVAGLGGMGTRRGGGARIGFLGGLMRGMWELVKFPFTLMFRPVQAIKQLLDIGGRGARGGRRATLGTIELLGGLLKLPWTLGTKGAGAFKTELLGLFRGLRNTRAGFVAFMEGFTSAREAIAKGTPTLSPLRRGLQGLWRTMIHSKGPVGIALHALDTFFVRTAGFGKWIGRHLLVPLTKFWSGMAYVFRPADLLKPFKALGGAMRGAIDNFLLGNFRTGPGFMSRALSAVGASLRVLGRPLRAMVDRFLLGNFRPSRGIAAGIFAGLFGWIPTLGRPVIGAFGRMISGITGSVSRMFLGFGDLIFGPGFMGRLQGAFTRVAGAIRNFFTPRGMGIIASPRAFQAFDTIAGMFERLTSRIGSLRKVGGFFDDIGGAVARMVKPLGGVSGIFGTLLRAASRLSPALRAIATAFAFFGIEQLIGKMGGLSGIFDSLKRAWNELANAFQAGGMRGVISRIMSALWDGLKALPGIIRDAISGLQDMGISGIWDWIKESASNIDWKLVGTIIITGLSLLIAGIPGLLIGIAAVFLWEWIYDSLAGFGWDRLGNMLESGFRNALEILRNVGSWIMDILQSALSFGWDFLREHGTTIMQALLDGMIAGGLTVWNWLSSLAAWLATAVSGAWDWLKENGTELLDTLLQAMITAGLTVYNWLSTLGDWLKSGVSAVWDWLSDKAGPLFDGLLQAMITAGMTVWTWLSGLGDWLKGATTIAWDWLSDKAGPLFDGLLQAMITAGLSVWNWLSSLGAWLATAVTGVWDWLSEKGSEVLRWLVTGMEDGFWAAWGWLSGLASRLGGAVSGVWDWLKEKGSELLESLVTGMEDGFWAAWDWLVGLLDRIMEAVGLEETWDGLKAKGAALLQSLADGFDTGWQAASAWLGDLTTKILDAAGESWDIFIDGGRDLMNGLLDGIESGWSTVSNWVSTIPSKIKGLLLALDPLGLLKGIGEDLWNGLKGGFETAFNGAQSFFEGIGKTVKGWIGSVASWFGLGDDGDDSVTADQLIDIDLNELATEIDAALAAAFRARGTGGELAIALSEYLQEQVQSAFMDIQLQDGGTLGEQIARNVEDQIALGLEVLSGSSDVLATAINDWFNSATLTLSGKSLGTAINDWARRAISGLGGESIGTAINDWINRATVTLSGDSLGTAINDWATRAIAGLGGESIGTAINDWVNRATLTLSGDSLGTALNNWAIKAISGLGGESLGVVLDGWFGRAFNGLSGASLSSSLTTWLNKGVALAAATMAATGLGFARAVNTAVTDGFGQLSGASLGGSIGSWFERGMTVALPTVETALTQITTSFTEMVNTVIALMGAWYQGVTNITANAMGEATSTIATANVSSTTSFESFVNDTIALMGAWYQGVTNIVTNAMRSMRDDITTGAAQSLSAVQRNFDAMASAISSAMRSAGSAISAAASSWPGIIDSYYYSMFAAGQRVGMAAGDGIVSGLDSRHAAVQAAANRIVSTAMAAMDVAAALGSPSRITTYFGEMMGQGIVDGIDHKVDAAALAAWRLMDAVRSPFMDRHNWVTPDQYRALTGTNGRRVVIARNDDRLTGRANTGNVTYVTITMHNDIDIEQKDGQSGRDIGREVAIGLEESLDSIIGGR